MIGAGTPFFLSPTFHLRSPLLYYYSASIPCKHLVRNGVWGVMEQKSGVSYEAALQADLWKSEKQFTRCKLPGRWHFLHLLVENTAISWP